MSISHVLWSTALIALTSVKTADANIDTGANRREFGAMCNVLRWTSTTFTNKADDWDDDKIYNSIADINMTLAEKEWRAMFLQEGQAEKWQLKLPTKHAENAAFQKMWALWACAAQRVGSERGLTDKLKKLKANELTATDLSLRRQRVQQIADKAHGIYFELKKLNRKKLKATPATIKAKIYTAVLGKADAVLGTDPTDDDSITSGGTSAATRSNGCGNSNIANQPGKNLGTVALCVCAKGASGTAVDDACWSETAAEVAYPTAASQAKTKIHELIKMCGTAAHTKLTADAVEASIKGLTSIMHTSSSGTYIGEYLATGCNGEDNGVVCFKYGTLTTTTNSNLMTIPWLAELHQLKQDLTGDDNLERAGQPLVQQLTILEAEVKEITAGELLMRQDSLFVNQPTHPASPEKVATVGEVCSKHNGSNTTCPRDKRTYDEKENKCNPIKQVEGVTAEGTGEKTTTEKCRGKLEKDCKSPDCKWEETVCKDSSFLVNKKLALISTNFVDLMF
ncbi:variant surface glycoprotein (VSG, atypical), putative [Trypanosoma brucei brucei TREU927]|uniref:Variant surface glycoprotein (VSG, atypical), putative n=1 Tax=Trypanosoma brucei brucei (strain 927/4 GUTat10.1) TaxID=185431 RepID=Q22KT7_TRYB2|nr:variant surface glycoprotein [Trypanosoma brucei brucei TREU927]EAN78993.1 variant surface glycoprotein (VSG, atypical), putative [Trypanosoma brucei brucei TREU927]